IAGAATYGIPTTAVAAPATWSAFRGAVTAFMIANAATGPDAVRVLMRPEHWSKLDGTLITNTAVSEWDRMRSNITRIVLSSNALAARTGAPLAANAFLTAPASSPPAVLATWGGIDLIRDPFKDAPSGMLNLTGLITADVTALRAVQSTLLTGVQT